MSRVCSANAVKAVVNTGSARLYDSAISGMKKEGILRRYVMTISCTSKCNPDNLKINITQRYS